MHFFPPSTSSDGTYNEGFRVNTGVSITEPNGNVTEVNDPWTFRYDGGDGLKLNIQPHTDTLPASTDAAPAWIDRSPVDWTDTDDQGNTVRATGELSVAPVASVDGIGAEDLNVRFEAQQIEYGVGTPNAFTTTAAGVGDEFSLSERLAEDGESGGARLFGPPAPAESAAIDATIEGPSPGFDL